MKSHITSNHKESKLAKVKKTSCENCKHDIEHRNCTRIRQKEKKVQSAAHLNENYRQTLRCVTCKFETKKNYYLTLHTKLMHGPGTEDSSILFCPHCEFGTKVAQSLKNHINAQHEDQKRYSCNLCSFRSYYRHHVKSHIANNHQGSELPKVKKIGCTNCEND